MIKCVEVSQADKALLCGWSIDFSLGLLKKWDPSFDASNEKNGLHTYLGMFVWSTYALLVSKMFPGNW